jgi:CAAX protease family protein
VEEWFFRYLALGSLRPFVGVHGAVLISAVMFGTAHIFNPLGIPMLMVVGVVLGYARVASGGMLLPILMHFGHNAAILLIEALL